MLYKDLYITIFKRKKYLKFIISGGLAALTNIFALYVFHGLMEVHIVFAASLSFLIAYFVSFSLQKFWTFSGTTKRNLRKQMIQYFFVGLLGLVVNALGMYLLVEILFVWYILSQIIMTGGLAIINYFLYKRIFGAGKMETGDKKVNKKILIATGIYPPDAGGPATYSKVLKEELAKKGFEVRIVAYGETEEADEDNNIFRVSRKQNVLSRYWKYGVTVWREAKWADLVYVQGPVSEGLPSYFACRLRHKKYILKVVGDFAWEQGQQRGGVKELLDDFQENNYSLRTELWRLVEIFVAHGAERVIVPSEYLKKIVCLWGRNEGDVTVIYNSVDLPADVADKNILREELGLSGRVIVSVGRLVPWKGFDELSTAVINMYSEFPDNSLIVIGDGPEEHRLKEKVKDYKDRVIFLGKLSHNDACEYIRAADLFVLNTGYEGLSHVLIEAMYLGTPIITTKVGGNPELIKNNESGKLISYGVQEELVRSIREVLNNYPEATERATKAKEDLERFTKKKMIEGIIDVIKGFDIYENIKH